MTIPPGIEEGIALRVPGRGHREPGGIPGDLFVVVRTAPDTIAVADAVLGTTLEVPTLAGKATVTVPPGSQPGATLRLRGQGLPEFGRERRGDLYVQLRVGLPTRLAAEERKLDEQLRVLGRKGKRPKS